MPQYEEGPTFEAISLAAECVVLQAFDVNVRSVVLSEVHLTIERKETGERPFHLMTLADLATTARTTGKPVALLMERIRKRPERFWASITRDYGQDGLPRGTFSAFEESYRRAGAAVDELVGSQWERITELARLIQRQGVLDQEALESLGFYRPSLPTVH